MNWVRLQGLRLVEVAHGVGVGAKGLSKAQDIVVMCCRVEYEGAGLVMHLGPGNQGRPHYN